MKTMIVFILMFVIAFLAFSLFSYMEQTFLGIILAGIIITWPIIFWLISKLAENQGKIKEENIKQDIIDEKDKEKEESETSEESEEFVVPPKKGENIEKLREDLEKLREVSKTLDEEKKEGILSEDAYIELKKRNEEAIEKIEEKIAKASGKIREKKVYCKKGDHYISVSKCLPSKIKGYVICPEHNEEIRVE